MRAAASTFDLPVFEFHWSRAAEDTDGDTQLAALGVDLFDDAALVLERAVGDLDHFADTKADLRFDLVLTFADLGEEALDFVGTHRDRAILRSGESDHPGRVLDEIPCLVHELLGIVEQVHVHDEVPGEKLPGRLGFLAALDLGDALRGQDDFVNVVAHFLGLDALYEIVMHLVFLAGKHMHHVPLTAFLFFGHGRLDRSGRCEEVMDDDVHDEIPARDVTAQEHHGDEHDERGVNQFLVFLCAFFLRLPRP